MDNRQRTVQGHKDTGRNMQRLAETDDCEALRREKERTAWFLERPGGI